MDRDIENSPAAPSDPTDAATRADRRRPNAVPPGYAAKRGLDIAVSSALILLLLPVAMIIAGLVGLGGNPVFFRSQRVGRGGRTFAMYKFRTMKPGAEHLLAAHLAENPRARLAYSDRYKLNPDPRVTPIGSVLRMFSLDELPQLLNVLIGDMSLVGPRPRLPREIADAGRYNTRLFEAYYLCRPGMTGLWQVSSRSESSYHTRIRLDALYVRQMSIGQDLAILARTIPVVLQGRGEY